LKIVVDNLTAWVYLLFMVNNLSPAYHSATATTTPYLFWVAAIEEALVANGVSGEWLRESAQRDRFVRYYHAGESAWMAADTLHQFWLGIARAAREDADGFSHIRKAARQ
jgi:hypothetical protein